MNKYKVGDRVTVVDDAWSRVFGCLGDRVRRFNSQGDIRIFDVVAISCQIRVNDQASATANTLLASRSLPHKQYVAINSCNCIPFSDVRNVDIQFIAAGENVTMKLSEESKKEILRAHLRNQ